jgi:hypothetical protein
LLIVLAGLAVSALSMVVALSGGREVRPGHYVVSSPALVALILAVCLAMFCLVFGVATLAASGRLDRRLHRIWTGKAGQLLFRLGSWRLRVDGLKGGQGAGRQGTLTLLETLDSASRRRLAGVRRVVGRLEGALEGLDRREQDFLRAAAEAKGSSPSLPGAVSDRQRALLDDLDRARRSVADRRVAVLGALEAVRLALIRVRSGLGTPEGVEAELAAATRLLETPAP